MPYTVLVTPKQRTTLLAMQQAAGEAQGKINAYLLAVLDGDPDVPPTFNGMQLTDDGVVLGDIPAVPEAPLMQGS